MKKAVRLTVATTLTVSFSRDYDAAMDLIGKLTPLRYSAVQNRVMVLAFLAKDDKSQLLVPRNSSVTLSVLVKHFA